MKKKRIVSITLVVFLLEVLVLPLTVLASEQSRLTRSLGLAGYKEPAGLTFDDSAAPAGRGTEPYSPRSFVFKKRLDVYEREHGALDAMPLEDDAWVPMLTAGNVVRRVWQLKGTMMKGKDGVIFFRDDCGNPVYGPPEYRPVPPPPSSTPASQPAAGPAPQAQATATAVATNGRDGRPGETGPAGREGPRGKGVSKRVVVIIVVAAIGAGIAAGIISGRGVKSCPTPRGKAGFPGRVAGL